MKDRTPCSDWHTVPEGPTHLLDLRSSPVTPTTGWTCL